MRFLSVHPTDIDDERAAALFLVLAQHWSAVPIDELARAFVACSVFEGELPEAFRSDLSMSARYGLLVVSAAFGVDHTAPFQTDVWFKQTRQFSVAAATTADGLVRAWGDVHHYGREPRVEVEVLAADYRRRTQEDHAKTLDRAARNP